jgi:hypothetical protein
MTSRRVAYLDEARLPGLRDEARVAFDPPIRETVADVRRQAKPS